MKPQAMAQENMLWFAPCLAVGTNHKVAIQMGCTYTKEEMNEDAKNPNFCVCCLSNRTDVKVTDHVCEECAKPT